MNEYLLVLKLESETFYRPTTPDGVFMLRHISGGSSAINKTMLEQVEFLAKAHGWAVMIEPEPLEDPETQAAVDLLKGRGFTTADYRRAEELYQKVPIL